MGKIDGILLDQTISIVRQQEKLCSEMTKLHALRLPHKALQLGVLVWGFCLWSTFIFKAMLALAVLSDVLVEVMEQW